MISLYLTGLYLSCIIIPTLLYYYKCDMTMLRTWRYASILCALWPVTLLALVIAAVICILIGGMDV